MAGKQISGDGLPPSLAGMSKNQLYDIMSQMKTLIEQNKQQAKEILIQNPALTRALFQAQIMLGMVQSPQASPAISSTASQNPPQLAMPNQHSNIQASVPISGHVGQNQIRKQHPNQPMNVQPQPIPNPKPQTEPTPSLPAQPLQRPKGHLGAQSTPMSLPQSSQVPNLTQLPQHTASQPPLHHPAPMPSLPSQSQPHLLHPPPMPSLPSQSLPPLHHQPPKPSLPSQSQPPMSNTGSQYLPLQPPLPPQQRPSILGFPPQAQSQMRPNVGFQHHGGPQMHHSQHMFHSGSNPSAGLGPSFLQGQLPFPNQPTPYQAGNPHMEMDFNQIGSSKQTDRGSNWMPGPSENTIGPVSGRPPFPGQGGPSNQPPRPAAPALTPELEKALLQQVMSLTPEQINMLPPDQRSQVLQLQQVLRQ